MNLTANKLDGQLSWKYPSILISIEQIEKDN